MRYKTGDQVKLIDKTLTVEGYKQEIIHGRLKVTGVIVRYAKYRRFIVPPDYVTEASGGYVIEEQPDFIHEKDIRINSKKIERCLARVAKDIQLESYETVGRRIGISKPTLVKIKNGDWGRVAKSTISKCLKYYARKESEKYGSLF